MAANPFKVGDLIQHKVYSRLKAIYLSRSALETTTVQLTEDWTEEVTQRIIAGKGSIYSGENYTNWKLLDTSSTIPTSEPDKKKCKYATLVFLPDDAPKPLATKGLDMPHHPEIKRYVCSNFHTWPWCPYELKTVDLECVVLDNPQIGKHYVGVLICHGCSMP